MADVFDVVVLGGGPAGTAAALTLCHYSGLSVVVVEKSAYEVPRIGETLSPGVQELLRYLRVWDAFVEAGHQRSFGTAAAWGGAEVQARDFIFSPYGAGWHLDRQCFDRMLAEAVRGAGGQVWCLSQVVACERSAEGVWRVTVRRDGALVTVQARWVIDATGKSRRFVKYAQVRRWVLDQLVGVAGVFSLPQPVPQTMVTLVEACELGWWYSTQLPGVGMIAAFMSDSDIVRAQDMMAAQVWLAALRGMPHTGERLRDGQLVGPVQLYAAHSAYLSRMFGDGWVAAGDAAASFDPLSSSGIPRALNSGIGAARAVYDCLCHGSMRLLEGYEAELMQGFHVYHATKTRYYQLEGRWLHSRFWRRRQQVARLDPHAVVQAARDGVDEEVWFRVNQDLTRRQYVLLCALCRLPTPAHQVVAAFQEVSRHHMPDQRVILALQDLVACGGVCLVDAEGGGAAPVHARRV